MEVRRVSGRTRAVALFLFALAFGMVVAGCGSGGGGAGSAPADTAKQAVPDTTVQTTAPEKNGTAEGAGRTAVVRLSGTEGTIYAGNYGNLDGSKYAEGLLEGEPVEFTVDLRKSGFDVVNASFSKPGVEDDGTLKIEIIAGDEVVAEQEAETQYGTLNLTWSSEG